LRLKIRDMNYKKISIFLLVALILAIFSLFTAQYYLETKAKNFLKRQDLYLAALKEIKENRVYYIISKGEENISEYQITEITGDETVFSLLEKLSQKEKFEIKTTQYDFGIFVESIADCENGTDGKFWQYWLNDKLGEVAADKKEVKKGDKIEWKFEVPPDFF